MQKNYKKEAKRIDVVVKYFYPLAAGIEVNIMNVYRHFADRGWDVYVHTTTDMPDAPRSLPESEKINGLHVRRYHWKWYGFNPSIDWQSTRALCLHNFNVFPHAWMMFYAWMRRRFMGSNMKVFLTPHGGFTPEWPIFPPVQRAMKKLYHQTVGLFLINNVVDGLRSVSEWERGETIKLGVRADIVRTIQNGLEREVLEDVDQLASDKVKSIVKKIGTYIVQIGRVHPIKNQKTVIKALPLMPKEVTYVMIGPVTDSDYDAELRKLIGELNLEDRVQFLGVVTGFDKYYLLRHALAGVHMAYWESYCNAVHEYMSQGRVCIVSKDTALEELIKDGKNGFCVGVKDTRAIARTVQYILEHKESKEIADMQDANIEFTKGHSWESISQRVEEFYGESLNNAQ